MADVMKIQAILYRSGDSIEYLLLKRPEERGGYWTPITGHVEKGEQLLDALVREIEEETGITNTTYTIDLRVPFRYRQGDDEVEEHAFAVQVEERDIRLSKEHTEYEWLGYDEAYSRLRWEEHRTCLRVLNDMINL